MIYKIIILKDKKILEESTININDHYADSKYTIRYHTNIWLNKLYDKNVIVAPSHDYIVNVSERYHNGQLMSVIYHLSLSYDTSIHYKVIVSHFEKLCVIS